MGSDRTQEVARQIASLSIRVEESRLENQAENMGASYETFAESGLSCQQHIRVQGFLNGSHRLVLRSLMTRSANTVSVAVDLGSLIASLSQVG